MCRWREKIVWPQEFFLMKNSKQVATLHGFSTCSNYIGETLSHKLIYIFIGTRYYNFFIQNGSF